MYKQPNMHTAQNHSAMVDARPADALSELDIAIIGMAGRFPKARTIDQFWDRLTQPTPCTTFWSRQELLAEGLPGELVDDPNYVGASLFLEDDDLFDAGFFSLSPAEAHAMDPQIRLMLEVSWSALENSGYNCLNYPGRIGHFAGMSMSVHLMKLLYAGNHYSMNDALKLRVVNDKDFLATRVAYHLNLRGPCMSVQTACSTSLVTVHLAVQSLLNGECDMALAGGVTIDGIRQPGYLYEEGAIYAKDGHCRAFDENSSGTVMGNGIGIVVLKPAADAIADGDTIHAIIKASAINNDGNGKLSYTAPGFEAQTQVISEALTLGDIDPATIAYVETHGTGTRLGDPVEVRALTEAYRNFTQRTGYCAIGSVKSHIGHLDAAAGIAGLIKAVQALKHHILPGNADFTSANPDIDFAGSPFYVSASTQAWPAAEHPRRAAVSAFAVGGTNAHIILQESPQQTDTCAQRPCYPIMLSAKTPEALTQLRQQLAAALRLQPQTNLADCAFTLFSGRKSFDQRFTCVARDTQALIEALENHNELCYQACAPQQPPDVVMLFSGQGAQYPGMGRGLYSGEPVYRQHVDKTCARIREIANIDLIPLLTENTEDSSATPGDHPIHNTLYAQLALFVSEYALAQLWLAYGVKPARVMGHSLGEYVAACIAGVLDLEDALCLVTVRAQLMARMPAGAMLSVSTSQKQCQALISVQRQDASGEDIWHAVDNGENLQVMAGTLDAIKRLESNLKTQGITCQRLKTSHAFHSGMMDAVLPDFSRTLADIVTHPAKIAWTTNLNGQTLMPGTQLAHDYFVRQLRHTVRFGACLDSLTKSEQAQILLETGPAVLCQIAQHHIAAKNHPNITTVASLPSARLAVGGHSDLPHFAAALGALWCHGLNIDASTWHQGQSTRRIPLPAYPFQGQRYWVDFVPLGTLTTTTTAAGDDSSPSETTTGGSRNSESAKQTGNAANSAPRPSALGAVAAATTDTEQYLLPLWQQVLGYTPVGIHDNYFDAGGNSLQASSLLARINQHFGLNIDLETLMSTPTIAAIAERIDADLWLAQQQADTPADNQEDTELMEL